MNADGQKRERPQVAIERDLLEVAAELLAREIEGHGDDRAAFSIALGVGELHIYSGCSELQWPFPKPLNVGGYPVEWHFGSIGMVTAREAAE